MRAPLPRLTADDAAAAIVGTICALTLWLATQGIAYAPALAPLRAALGVAS